MPEYAHIESLDALKRFRAALIKFADGIGAALDESEAEVQRTDRWLHQEQPAYWKHQLSVRAELHTRAKSALNRKQMQTSGLNNRPSCVDELKELARAERALEEARHKQSEVRRWARLFEQESFGYSAVTQRLRTAAQTALPRALAQLDAMIEAIEAYGGSPEVQWQRSTVGSAADGAGLGEDAEKMTRSAPASAGAAQGYSRFRDRSPTAAERDAISLPPSDCAAKNTPEPQATASTETAVDADPLPADLLGPPQPPRPDEKVILGAGVDDAKRVWLERARSVSVGDSGWFVGAEGETEEPPYGGLAIRVRELIARWPTLSGAVSFPPGSLVFLDRGSLEAVLDANDVIRWYRGQMMPESGASAPVGTNEDRPTNCPEPRSEARSE